MMKSRLSRRNFLGAAAAAMSLPVLNGETSPASAAPQAAKSAMPMVPFGAAHISRLVIGSNTINGGSHLSPLVDASMKEYFTKETILSFLKRCELEGINMWQASFGVNLELWEEYKNSGGVMHYMTLIDSRPNDGRTSIETAKKRGVLALAHHGEVTDSLYKEGRLDEIRDFLKKIRDAGLMVGVSTHMPAVVEYIEEKNWDVDFYMTCVYERHRSREELKKLLGYVPIPVREVYLEEDPPRMYAMIRATEKTCLAFKILAAGRFCRNQKELESAFRQTFENIKPKDAVIVGMFPRYSDQVKEDADLARRFGGVL